MTKKFLTILLSIILIAASVAGCSGGAAPTAAPVTATEAPAAQVQPTAAPAATEAVQPTAAPALTPTVDAVSSDGQTKTITDSANRQVVVPAVINKVYSTSPVGTIFMYSLAPDKVAGLSWALTEAEKKYTLESFHNLPVLSGNFGQGQTMNKEEILKAKPDIILVLGDLGFTDATAAQKIQDQMKIPVVVVGMTLDTMDQAYLFMGDLLGVQDRAKQLADYVKKSVDDVKTIAKTIPEDKKIKVYYAEDKKGLTTDPSGSQHSEVLDMVGGINVADVQVTKGYGRTPVSMEQILAWNPQLIIVCYDEGFAAADSPFEVITTDSSWANVKAVQDKQVYMIPHMPFNWFDRPPSINRIPGIKWLANLLYPDYYKYDIRKETQEFYQLFYQRTLTDAELDEILANSVRK